MLYALHLRNFVIVDSLELHFQTGFTVLTGETGAGKSILIDALSLLLGERAETSLVRQGCARAEIGAEFSLDPDEHSSAAVLAWLDAQGFETDTLSESTSATASATLILRRTIEAEGRSRAFINGGSATLAQLRELGEQLVDIHGQHAHQSLMRPGAQRDLLDAYAGQQAGAQLVRQLFQQWQTARAHWETCRQHAAAHRVERDQLRWQIEEFDTLAPQENEWSTLEAEHHRLSHAAHLIEGCQAALALLREDETNLEGQLAAVQGRIAQLAAHDPRLEETRDLLAATEAHLGEAVHALRQYVDRLELDPERLAEISQRMEAMHRFARKHRLELDLLPEQGALWQARLATLEESGNEEALTAAVETAEKKYRAQAETLSAARRQAATRLSQAVSAEMQRMAMAGSRLEVVLTPLENPAGYGLENVELQIAAHAGSPARSLARVASGGELSRISLAIQVVAVQLARVPTLIFDEVDVGIGGAVAEIVGRLLRQLGTHHQVLCVTHLPQVAANARGHYQVSKRITEPATGKKPTAAGQAHAAPDAQGAAGVSSHIVQLDEAARIEEIARMLGGVEITATTRRHAAELLAAGRLEIPPPQAAPI